MAERMVKEFGMSERIGLVAHREDRSQQFLGMGAVDRPYGDETAKLIDEEVKGILGAEYIRAKELLGEHREALEEIVGILFENEVMDGDELRKILEGHGVVLPPKPNEDDAVPAEPAKAISPAQADEQDHGSPASNGNSQIPQSETEGIDPDDSSKPKERDAP